MKDLAQLKEDIASWHAYKYADDRILKRYSAAVEGQYCHFCGKCEELPMA